MPQRRGRQSRPLLLGADDLFNRTRRDFALALADHERANFTRCNSIEELLADIKALESFSRSRRRTTASLAKVKAFGDNLEPYFKILEIVCGAHPEWANVALGALRLILQLASSFISFFEKLCAVVETVNARLPRYAELYERLAAHSKPPTPRLEISLKETFVALFEFFQAVARVFSNPSGKARGAAFVVADLMWKPFDLRFQNVIEKINFHQGIVKEELDIAAVGRIQDDIEELKEAQAQHATERAQGEILVFMSRLAKKYDQQLTERYQSSVIRWIDPPDFKENLSDAQEERTEGTAEWIFDDPVFMGWRNSRTDSPMIGFGSLLWINGKPGAGKTVLAGSIIEELGRGENVADSPPLTCYYFFSQNSGGKSTRIDAYRAIAAQLFHQCRRVPIIHDIYALATTEIATDTKASEQELVDLIRQCLSVVPNLFLILDGVDECKGNARLLKDTIEWCATSPVQIALLSRPDIAFLRKSIDYRNTITLNQQLLADDISRYLTPELENMADESLLPAGADIPKLVQHLVERAEGMFLWARVMVAYLGSPALMKQQRVKTIMEKNPSGLDRLEDLYMRIHKGIDSLDKPSKELAYKALLWVAHTQISAPELKEAIFADDWDVDSGDACAEFEHAVIVSCRGFIEKKNSGVFKYIHLTARSFAQSGGDTSTAQSAILPDEHVAKALIASRCVSYLKSKLPLKPLSGQMGVNADPNVLITRCPLLKYAAWWPNLSLDAVDGIEVDLSHPSMTDMFTQLNDYLENGLCIMVWVETLYTLDFGSLETRLKDLVSRSQDLANALDKSSPHIRQFILEMNEMLADISRLDTDWNSTLKAAPCEIWGDVTIFAKSRFLVPTKAGTLESLAPTLSLENSESAIKPLFSTSRSSADSKRLAILSVFPCRYFRDGWEKTWDIPYYPDRPEKRTDQSGYDQSGGGQVTSRPVLPITLEEIKDACCGWTATYEIMSVMTSKSDSVLLITIPINPIDVEICLRQSLWHSWSIFDGDLSTWLCSFTLSISPRLDTFTILDNLTYLDSSSVQHAVKIPLTSHVRYNDLWTRARQFRRVVNGYYTYQFTWSADGRHLALTDFDCIIAGRVSDGTTIAVFSVKYGAAGPQLEPLTSFHGSGLAKGMHGCQFHPSENLLLFQDEANSYLWDFLDREMVPKAIRFSDGFNSHKQYDEVSFSQCGRFLAVYTKGRPWPELRPITEFIKSRMIGKRKISYPARLVRSKRRRMANGDEESDEEDDDEDVIFEDDAKPVTPRSDLVTYNGENVSIIASPHTTVTTSAIVVTGGAEPTLTSCKITSNMVEIHSKSSSEEARTPVVKLPRFIPTRDMSAQVAAPEEDEDPALYKVILNATPTRPYLSGLPSAAEYLPLIVRKDARSLMPVITQRAIAGAPSAQKPLGPRDVQDDVMMLDSE